MKDKIRYVYLWIICICMIFSSLPVFGAEGNESFVILNTTYNDMQTHYVPDNVMALKGTEVADNGRYNKYLKILSDENASSVTYTPESLPEKFVVSLDVLADGNLGTLDFVLKNESSSTKLFTCGLNGPKLYNGKSVWKISSTKWTTIAFSVDVPNKKYIMYKNGTEVSDAWPGSDFGAIKSFALDFSAADGKISQLCIDNVRIYSGTSIRKDIPGGKYNPEIYTPQTDENNDETETKEDDVTIYVKENFDAHFSPESVDVSQTLKSDQNKLLINSEGDNKYLYMERNISDPHINFYCGPKDESFIMQMDVASDDLSGPVKQLAMGQMYIQIQPGGSILSSTGAQIGKLNKSGFTNIAFKVNPKTYQYEIFIDGKSATKKLRTNEFDIVSSLFRIYFYNLGGKGSIKLDNFLVYSGEELIDINEYGGFSKLKITTDQDALEQVGDGIAVHQMSDRAIIKGERVDLSQKPEFIENELWIPVEVFEKAGIDVDISAQTVNKTGLTFKKINEVWYVKISEAAHKALGFNYYVDNEGFGFDKGFAIMGREDYSAFKEDFLLYNEANNYLAYKRPKADEILEQFNKQATPHPRLMATEADFEQLKREIKYNETKAEWFDNIIKNAQAHLNSGLPTHSLDGARLNSIHGLADPIINLCLAYKLTGDERYAEKVYADLAHMGTRADWNPWHFLDVGVGARFYAIAYDWLYDYWTPERRENLENIMLTHALMEYHNSIYNGKYQWIDQTVAESMQGNWPIVCTSGPVMAALAMMDVYPEICAEVVQDGFKIIEYALKGFADDGDWVEGPLYWSYTNTPYSYMIASCDTALGTDYGYYYDVPGVIDTVYYAAALLTPTGVYNFGDSEGGNLDLSMASWHSSKIAKVDEQKALDIDKLILKYYKARNLKGSMWDMLKIDNRAAKGEPKGLDKHYNSDKTGYAIARSDWGLSAETMLGYLYGGKLRLSHDHIDIGSFIFHSKGKKWAVDLGRDDYNMIDYYNVAYRVRAEGHNVYVINPDEGIGQVTGTYNTYLVDKQSNDSSYYSIVDITSAYEPWVNKARRGYKLTDNMDSLIVRDEITFKESSDFYWFMHTQSEPVVEGNTVYLKDGITMKLEFIANQPLELGVMDAVRLSSSPRIKGTVKDAPNTGIKKIYLKGRVSGDLNVTVKITPLVEGAKYSEITDTPLEQWKLDEVIQRKAAPKLSKITIDGENFSAFKPDVTTYSYMKVGSQKPVIEAVSEEGNVSINLDDKSATIIVSDKNDGNNYNVYCIDYKNLNTPNDVSKYRFINPAELTASSEPQSENPIVAAMDGNLNTRWAANGEQWIMQTFDRPRRIGAVELSWINGSRREAYFKIQYSVDGENFTTIIDTASSASTDDLELYEFEPVEAKYIRILCNGSSEGTWTSMSEFYVHETK